MSSNRIDLVEIVPQFLLGAVAGFVDRNEPRRDRPSARIYGDELTTAAHQERLLVHTARGEGE